MKQSIIWILASLLILYLGIRIWQFFGMPYYRLSLLGTEYIEDPAELYSLNVELEKPFLLAKKYMYSKDALVIGYGGGSTQTVDYYALGVYSNEKKEVIPTKYQYIFTRQNHKTGEIYLACTPHYKTGLETEAFYTIENTKAILQNTEP